MPITMFDHYTLRSADVDLTANFYERVMGFRVENWTHLPSLCAFSS
jgi:catechol 2,3-dioxygenase-like lactoylglutathione lyase family enzyme